jgi:hypothetical protein
MTAGPRIISPGTSVELSYGLELAGHSIRKRRNRSTE